MGTFRTTRSIGAVAALALTSLAGVVGTTTTSASADAACVSDCGPPPEPTSVTINVIKQFEVFDEGTPTPVEDWPFTLTLDDESATFADDSTTMDVTTDADGKIPPVEVVGVTEDLFALTITEPQRADAEFVGVSCTYPDNEANPVEDSGDGSVTLFIHPSYGSPTCTFTNHQATPVTVIKQVDGETSDAGSTAGYDFVVWPADGTAGIGSDIHEDGIFTTSDAPTVVNVTGFGDRGYQYAFIGEVVQPGSSLTGIECTQPEGEAGFGASAQQIVDGPAYFVDETEDGDTVIGQYVLLNPWSPMTCTIDNTSAGISATKTASVPTVAPSGALNYTITATNSAQTPLTSAQLVDVVPSSLTIVGLPANCTAVQNTVTCSLGDLEVGASASVVLQTTVSGSIADAATITNVVDVSADAALWSSDLDVRLNKQVQPTIDAPAVPIETAKVTATANVTVTAAVPATTTTAAPTTTTTTPPTTTTTTALVSAEAPTPSTAPDLTGVLPTTGTDSTGAVTIAGWSLLAGALLLFVRRRRLHSQA